MVISCPACDNKLAEVAQSGITVDVCQNGCGGMWFDNQELDRVLKLDEPAIGGLLKLGKHTPTKNDPAMKRNCPRCVRIHLQRHFFSLARGVEVDTCYACGGVWVDAQGFIAVRAEYPSKEERSRLAAQWLKERDEERARKFKAAEEERARAATVAGAIAGCFAA